MISHGLYVSHVKSVNSVTATLHEDTVKNGLLTDVIYYSLTDICK